MSNSAMIKPALANTKIPKYIKKTLKFAKGVDGGESPGRNSTADQWEGDSPSLFSQLNMHLTIHCWSPSSDTYYFLIIIYSTLIRARRFREQNKKAFEKFSLRVFSLRIKCFEFCINLHSPSLSSNNFITALNFIFIIFVVYNIY